LAQEARRQLREGIDPIRARDDEQAARKAAAAKSITFNEAAKQCIKSKRAGWKNEKHADQWETTLLGDRTAHLHRMNVAIIDTPDVLKVLQPIWTEIPETADRIRNRIEAVLGWAGAHGYRTAPNCARWVKHLDQVLPKKSDVRRVEHHPALPYVQMSDFIADLRQREGVAARALEWTVLAAARTNETTGGLLTEIDRAGRVWTIPAARMKSERPHRVPITDRMLEILDELAPLHEATGRLFLFPSPDRDGALSNAAMAAVLDRMNAQRQAVGQPRWIDPKRGRDAVPHGFRSSFRDWAGETTTFEDNVIEFSIAHVEGSKARKAYARSDLLEKRRLVMTAWAAFVDGEEPPGMVLQFARPA
jgi:integrase